MKKTLTGVVSTNGGAIYVTPLDKNAEIEYLLFNSPVNYQIKIYKNGTGIRQSTPNYGNGGGWSNGIDITGLIYLNGSTDYVEIYVYFVTNTSNMAGKELYKNFAGFLVRD